MRRAAALLCVLLALPASAHAQRAGRVVPYAGFSVGTAQLPAAFDRCGSRYTAAELRGGVARGPVAVEARVSAAADLGTDLCRTVLEDPFVPPDGVHEMRSYPDVAADGAYSAADLRLRLGGTRGMPLVVSAGTGWLRPAGTPYGVAGAGVRLGRRVRLALDAERTWYWTRRVDETSEWKDGQRVRLVSIDRRREWLDGFGLRAGVDVPFR